MREYRHARFRLHAGDQALAAARHDDVDGAIKPGEHLSDCGAIARRHQLDCRFRQSGLAQTLAEGSDDGAACAQAVGAAAQDRRVAGFQGERAGVCRYVRAAFIDDADDAERHAHALDGHAVRPRPGFSDSSDRVLERRNRIDCRGDRLDALGIECEPVEKSAGHAGGARLGDILGIGGEDARRLSPHRLCHGRERPIFLSCWGERQSAGSGSRRLTDFTHESGDFACPINTFQRCTHRGKACQNPTLGVVPTTSDGVRRGRRIVGIAWITTETREPVN